MRFITVRFDGKALIPEEPLDLPQNVPMVVRIETLDTGPQSQRRTDEDESGPASVPGYLTMEQDQVL